MSEVKYPEAEKWAGVHNDAVVITAFEQWQEDKYGNLERWQWPKLEDRIYEYFEIDYKKLEAERQQMLAELQG